MFLVLIFSVLVLLFLITLIKTKFSLPNGPMGLPYLGYSLFLGKPLFKTLFDLSRKYGKIYSFTAFGKNVVILNDYNIIKEVLLKRKEFSGRTTLFVNGALAEKKGISNYDGPGVEIKRKFIQNFLKMNENFEGIIDIEAAHFIDHISKISGSPIYSRKLYNMAVCNIIWKIIFGARIDYSDSESLSNVEKVAINNSKNDMISFKQFIPAVCCSIVSRVATIRKILQLEDIFKRYRKVIKFLQKSSTNEECNFDIDSDVGRELNSEQNNMPENEKLRLIFELFAAGTDTIILTLQWSTLLLAIHPEEQEKMREEIRQIISPNIDGKVILTWSDRSKLRYCQQVITEIHRIASVTPLALPHRVTKSCTLSSYQIPADTVVLLGIYAVHHDPDIWANPEHFNPGRFDDKSLTDNIIPFSLGKRTCPGAMLAQAEIFTILLNIVYNFRLTPAEENLTVEDLGFGTSGLTRGPDYHEVIYNRITE